MNNTNHLLWLEKLQQVTQLLGSLEKDLNEKKLGSTGRYSHNGVVRPGLTMI